MNQNSQQKIELYQNWAIEQGNFYNLTDPKAWFTHTHTQQLTYSICV